MEIPSTLREVLIQLIIDSSKRNRAETILSIGQHVPCFCLMEMLPCPVSAGNRRAAFLAFIPFYPSSPQTPSSWAARSNRNSRERRSLRATF